jgi:hypothetical protein
VAGVSLLLGVGALGRAVAVVAAVWGEEALTHLPRLLGIIVIVILGLVLFWGLW